MDETQQRIKIAEDQGYELKHCKYHGCESWHDPQGLCLEGDDSIVLPDYLNDLNAMNEVLRGLNEVDQNTFCITLWAILETGGDESFDSINATAKQRAEAYLRTKGLWDE